MRRNGGGLGDGRKKKGLSISNVSVTGAEQHQGVAVAPSPQLHLVLSKTAVLFPLTSISTMQPHPSLRSEHTLLPSPSTHPSPSLPSLS